jgi:hypothetical protein
VLLRFLGTGSFTQPLHPEFLMLTVTDPAAARLQQLLKRSDDGSVVRIVRRERRLKLQKSRPRAGDTEFTHGGRVVLVLGRRASQALTSRTLGVRQTEAGPRLSLKDPAPEPA